MTPHSSSQSQAAAQPEPLLLVCVVSGKQFLDELLEAYLEIGITGATVLQSQGMGHILAKDMPLFAGFKELFQAGSATNYTILSVVHDPKLIDALTEIIPSVKQEDSKGVIFTLPVSRFFRLDALMSPKR